MQSRAISDLSFVSTSLKFGSDRNSLAQWASIHYIKGYSSSLSVIFLFFVFFHPIVHVPRGPRCSHISRSNLITTRIVRLFFFKGLCIFTNLSVVRALNPTVWFQFVSGDIVVRIFVLDITHVSVFKISRRSCYSPSQWRWLTYPIKITNQSTSFKSSPEKDVIARERS